jgi:hypothetical protein
MTGLVVLNLYVECELGGVESWYIIYLSSMPPSEWEGWLILDRVIEAAVLQCTLT